MPTHLHPLLISQKFCSHPHELNGFAFTATVTHPYYAKARKLHAPAVFTSPYLCRIRWKMESAFYLLRGSTRLLISKFPLSISFALFLRFFFPAWVAELVFTLRVHVGCLYNGTKRCLSIPCSLRRLWGLNIHRWNWVAMAEPHAYEHKLCLMFLCTLVPHRHLSVVFAANRGVPARTHTHTQSH